MRTLFNTMFSSYFSSVPVEAPPPVEEAPTVKVQPYLCKIPITVTITRAAKAALDKYVGFTKEPQLVFKLSGCQTTEEDRKLLKMFPFMRERLAEERPLMAVRHNFFDKLAAKFDREGGARVSAPVSPVLETPVEFETANELYGYDSYGINDLLMERCWLHATVVDSESRIDPSRIKVYLEVHSGLSPLESHAFTMPAGGLSGPIELFMDRVNGQWELTS